jgi:hypothetical protein
MFRTENCLVVVSSSSLSSGFLSSFQFITGSFVNFLLHFKLVYLDSTTTMIVYNVILNRCTSGAMEFNKTRRQLQLIDNALEMVEEERGVLFTFEGLTAKSTH